MFPDILVHESSAKTLQDFLGSPTHALVLYGPSGNGKSLIAERLAAALLGTDLHRLESTSGYLKVLPTDNIVSIETARTISAHLSLKMPGKNAVRRVVTIVDAEKLTIPAQQSILKLIEEPPEDTVIILTVSTLKQLLPTIISRTQKIFIRTPEFENIATLVDGLGRYDESTVRQAYNYSGGSIGNTLAYLGQNDSDDANDFKETRRIVGLPLFEQLLTVENELKDKSAALKFVHFLNVLSETSLHRTAGTPNGPQWQRISQASLIASEALKRNANPKLVLTELMLSFREIKD